MEKKICWKTFLKQPLLVNTLKGIGRDGDFSPAEQFVCHVYGTQEQLTVNHVRLQQMLPPTRDALELHLPRANHQVKIWLQADQEHIDVPIPTNTIGWEMDQGGLQAIRTRIPVYQMHVSSGCRTKCGTGRRTCLKKNWYSRLWL
ncbi:hypothetical protein Hamer_G017631 [Homarus americanus]|uniref:Uncharacterized protein n=1 Tax=Homarus americanus TaxID=6706 RepID=A0A8J5J5W3_HOMAM|nr:hypothetical protein Hamer_G017631 [Homarus americanus]